MGNPIFGQNGNLIWDTLTVFLDDVNQIGE
jgi:hypothetical protein